MSVASILKAKGAHVETTRPDTTLYTVVWDLKVKGIGALVVSEDGSTVLGLISERDIVRGLTERGTQAPHNTRLRADDLPRCHLHAGGKHHGGHGPHDPTPCSSPPRGRGRQAPRDREYW